MDNKAEGQCFTTLLIDGDGILNAQGLDNFIKNVELGERELSYAIIAVMGPQSSGKSTLLNHLLDTKFEQMDAYKGRTQTTKGIWIARCMGIKHCTIAMDLEGSDGRERGEDDTLFERQIALFAMVVSDIMLINIWCHDIGREHGANKPLLRIVFQEMLRIRGLRKTTLMLVIRDKSLTPFRVLEHDLMEDIKKIWDSVPKARANKHIQLSECFNVEVVALSSYETQETEFKEEVAKLRKRLFQSIAPSGLARDNVPGSAFSLSAKMTWKLIKENKEIDFPSHRVMVATKRCQEIADEKYSTFAANQDWLKLKERVESNGFPGSWQKLCSLVDDCLSSYDEEVSYYDATIGSEKRKKLNKKLLKLVEPTFKLISRDKIRNTTATAAEVVTKTSALVASVVGMAAGTHAAAGVAATTVGATGVFAVTCVVVAGVAAVCVVAAYSVIKMREYNKKHA
ncbi:hypothetical protein QVD17_25689 [Tagetes erecta]|uniref:GB1/RHD3-type G domain-containing protein n=1 Tax=Tagetes erecta TaxID=13708 RepID=A0AAD8KJC0_TARER|nr:hypothetical protein QVD17_25689 [Tagetes erecta]